MWNVMHQLDGRIEAVTQVPGLDKVGWSVLHGVRKKSWAWGRMGPLWAEAG